MENSIKKSVRVRFAPSPTGDLHIGSLRTALFNWLFAKHYKGTFLIRVEDTDRARSTKEYEQSIIQSLEWTGIVSDEPIVYQFDQLSLHKSIVDRLIKEGKAYKCFCPEKELQSKKEKVILQQETYQYDKSCRMLPQDQQQEDQPYVVRFQVDLDQEIFTFTDAIKGEISVPTAQIDDFIILRSDQTVTYNLAVVQDDFDMNITHVIRGEDHLINTVKQILLYQALGYPIPVFAHIPLILGRSGQKLSKRDAITSVESYKKQGYLAEALCNYLVRLGWSYEDKEMFTQQEMIDLFSLEGVHKSGAKFDNDKLLWMNSVYLKEKSIDELMGLMQHNLLLDLQKQTSLWSEIVRASWIALYLARVDTLYDLYEKVVQAYALPMRYDWDALKQIIAKDVIVVLQLLQQEFESVEFDKQQLLSLTKDFCKTHEYKMADIARLLRFALLGTISGPSVFDMMVLYGKSEVQLRISHVISLM